ncbi:MAG: 30S ribosome-binding factor RbfA [Treponema sp.]|nr:30S ribosome-binding factor RbfA [Spirochaetia bacterium]MDD7579588.1 30S ribosome-binding factor RbfA [Treponema sp.]MCI7440241.1 30S ribosome-binding factor RbfA [Spirochaetia bacterium]MDY3758341.1 30S ribosome-binding factor RbfA [Treponema sp.]MDY4130344.1 30S ribosome-binding factor RbfA [Treponema sp.]
MGQFRLLRLGEQLRKEISSMLMKHEIKDPRVNEFLSINKVEVSGDLAFAKVYVSSFLDDASVERGVQGLQSAAGFIQSTIARKVSIYRFPKFTFVADYSMKEGYKMVQKLNELEKETLEWEKNNPQTQENDLDN